MKPTIGRIVIYRSRTGDYDVPAIVTATRDTLYRPGVGRGDVPDLSSDDHLHLTVFTPGASRAYQEFDVPQQLPPALGPSSAEQILSPRSWRWPDRA